MRKGFQILLVVLLLATVGSLAWLALRGPAGPVYNGKALSVWLQNFNSDVVDGREAEDAVRHIGTNAIPMLLSMLRAKDSGLKIRFIRLLARQNWIKIKVTPAADRNYAACSAFVILGTDAKSAVPELIQIYGQDISTESKCLTADALGYIGPPATNAIPALLQGLKTANDPVRWNTVWALGKIHSQPELVVPELIKLLNDPNYRVRMIAKDALSDFGTNARTAIPILIEMLNDQNLKNRELATNALKQIDPQAEAKVGVK